MKNILVLITLVVLAVAWISFMDKKNEANDKYWSAQVDKCSKVGGFMDATGSCIPLNQ